MDIMKGFRAYTHRLTANIDIIAGQIPALIATTIVALSWKNFDATNQVSIL